MKVVGQVPRAFFKYITLVLLSGGSVWVTVTGKQRKLRNIGQEVPCSLSVKGHLITCNSARSFSFVNYTRTI